MSEGSCKNLWTGVYLGKQMITFPSEWLNAAGEPGSSHSAAGAPVQASTGQ